MRPSFLAPTWRRLVGVTVAVFLVVLGFLAVHVWAGDDPALGRLAAHAQTTSTPATASSSGSDPSSSSSSPSLQPDAGAPTTHAS